jgi:glycosyltransferase involved in cell wall biosynthesis
MRYIWDRFDDYFPRKEMTFIRHGFIRMVARGLRKWDVKSAKRVDLFLADSNFVKARIKQYYNRPARVIYPFAETEYFTPIPQSDGEYFLLVGALVPYKKAGLVIEAFRGLKEKLVVVGNGPDLFRLMNTAPSNVTFTGWLDEEGLRDHYRHCRALIFPGVEDFGIVPVEAQACGRPVIAFGEGGIRDTVKGLNLENIDRFDDTITGLFFGSQTVDSLRETLKMFTRLKFNQEEIRKNALRFSKDNFYSEMREFLTEAYTLFRNEGKAQLEERLTK